MFSRFGPYIAAVLAALLAALGVRYMPPPTPAAPAPPPATAPANPPDTKPTPPPPKPEVEKAIARIQFPAPGGTAGCTATVIGPRRDDGKWWVLTAAHCVQAVGDRGTMRLLDGRTLGVQVQSVDRRADACWLATDSSTEALPFALLAEGDPPPGTRVWHAGYGVDRPGSREDGEVVATSNADGQIQFRLNVSSGDSGGGICVDATGRVVSTVCCTTAKGQLADVWGAGPAAIRRAKPTAMVMDDWSPVPIPIRPTPKAMPPKEPAADK